MTAAAIIFSLVLICFNGAFVGFEFGLIGAQPSRIDAKAVAGNKSARSAQRMQLDVLTTLGGAQLGITVCSLAVGRLAEPAVSGLIEDGLDAFIELPSGVLHTIGFAVALALVAVLHMVIGEMVPKNLALIGPERTLLVLARPMAAYLIVARPILRTLLWASNFALTLMKVPPKDELSEQFTSAQFASMVSESAESELVDDQASAWVNAALKFEATLAADVMTPISAGRAVQLGQSLADVGRQFLEADTTRLTVYGNDRSDVRGFVHCTDLVATANTGESTVRKNTVPKNTGESTVPKNTGESTAQDFTKTKLGTEHLREIVRISADATLPQVVATMRASRVNLLLVTSSEESASGDKDPAAGVKDAAAGTKDTAAGAKDTAGGTSLGVIHLDDLMDLLTDASQPNQPSQSSQAS